MRLTELTMLASKTSRTWRQDCSWICFRSVRPCISIRNRVSGKRDMSAGEAFSTLAKRLGYRIRDFWLLGASVLRAMERGKSGPHRTTSYGTTETESDHSSRADEGGNSSIR